MRLEGTIAVVTGGGSGFGEGIVRRFASEGAVVVLADVNGEAGQRVARAIEDVGGRVLALSADVSSDDDMRRLASTTVERFGRVDVVVNNAGATHRNGSMLDVAEDEFDRIFRVNVKSVYLAAKRFVPHLRAGGGGSFINIASTAAVRPRPGLTWYNGSKGAVVTITKSMAVELAPDNIRANCVNPVMGATGLLSDFMGAPDTPEARARFASTIPLGRFCTPADVASACTFLASPEASFITGACLEVDGGRCI